MASISQRLDVLHEYEAWKQEITLMGVDTSLEAYEGHLQHEENGRLVNGVRNALDGRVVLTEHERYDLIVALLTEPKEDSA